MYFQPFFSIYLGVFISFVLQEDFVGIKGTVPPIKKEKTSFGEAGFFDLALGKTKSVFIGVFIGVNIGGLLSFIP